MTAGFFAPMPPARSGVADHAADLLPALRAHGSVELAPDCAAVNIYHLGNNQLHADIYRRALREPGIVVLHDAVLHHFFLGSMPREAYIDEFVYNYGEWARQLANDLWAQRARSAADARYFGHPMLKRIAERSRAVVVHNPAAADMVVQHAPEAQVFEIPLLFVDRPTPDTGDILDARRRLGWRSSDLVCGVFGHLRESKRIHTVLRACEAAGLPLLLAGPMPSDLERALDPHLHAPWLQRVGHTPTAEFSLLAHAVDVCINLRYPAAGETSAIGVMMMGAGKAVLMTGSREVARYPDTACIRIETGTREQKHLEDVLLMLKNWPLAAREIGLRAAHHIRRVHSAARVAALYWETIRAVS